MPTTTHHTPGPLDLDIRVQAGRVEIETAETDETTVELTISVASVDTGLPGNASTSALPIAPHSNGMPGFMRTFQKCTRPCVSSSAGTRSFSPAETPPQVITRSKDSAASRNAIPAGESG